jgi:hypothetical protein
MKIAGELTINDWKDLEKKLKLNYENHWAEAYNYFETRINTRYLIPIDAIISIKSYSGEGFSIVNLQCSLIETIESFIDGWMFEYPNFINPNGVVLNGNKKIFKSFFKKREPFINYIPKISGERFYLDVRCGLLHETQTRNNWKIKKGFFGGDSYKFDGEFKIIYQDIVALLKKYEGAIINGVEFDGIPPCELRENFIAKMNHICKKSVNK